MAGSESERGNLQFSASYSKVEDRITLRGAFPDGNEVRLWLTRRLTRGFLGAIDQLAQRLVPAGSNDPAGQQMMVDFAREAAVQSADFEQPYAEGTPLPPMAEGPRLVKTLSLTPGEGAYVAVTFGLVPKGRVDCVLPAAVVWNLAHLIARQADRAGWDLPPPTAAEPPARVN
ncbi:MAG: hypothetical protein QF893_16875 [Alphaproteobacteria bacterium]|nr:hypothetical protein [Alphaproteobacteria bacterium]